MAEYNDIKPAIIGAEVILNLTLNTLLIVVLARYSQLREDRSALFMLSLSAADLATGCIVLPIGAAVCSRATPSILDDLRYLPPISSLALWWFGFVSFYSLCWLTMSKAVAIVMPYRSEQLLSRTRCYILITMTWIIGFLLASVSFKVDATWNTDMCTSGYTNQTGLRAFYMAYFVVAAILPRVLLVYGTIRIFIVVMRTHRQIAAQAQSIAIIGIATQETGTVTAQSLRSSTNVLVVCLVSIILTTPSFVFMIIRNATDMTFPPMLAFAAFVLFEFNTIMDSLLYLLLFRAVRKKTCDMLNEAFLFIRGLWITMFNIA